MGRYTYNDNMKHIMKRTRKCLYVFYVAPIKLRVLRLMKD